jgi:hypothetical protein
MPDNNELNEEKPSMPDVNEEAEFILNDEELEELEEPSPSRVPEKLPAGASKAKKTQDGYKNALNYINRFLTEKKLPAFDDLTPEDVEADHLQNWIENIMHWLALNQFKTHQGTYLMVSAKVKLFSQIKMVWQHRFPDRNLWGKDKYWKELLNEFNSSCARSRILDPNVQEMRKSAPLYRDLGSTRSTAVRAKYLNERVDAKTVVAMAMIKDGSKAIIQKLAEFNLCRQAIGRRRGASLSTLVRSSLGPFLSCTRF